MWRETTKHERNRIIFQEEFDGFLPGKILDFHVHIWNAGAVPPGKGVPLPGVDLVEYNFGDLRQDLAETYPRRETYAVCFGMPFPGFDLRSNNEHIAAHCDNQRFFGLRLLDPNEPDREAFASDLARRRFVGVKPYLDYVKKANRDEVEIDEMLPAWAMEIVDRLGMIVMLHIPRKERLADPLNQKQLARLCESYPRAKIVLAHVGRAYYLKNVLGRLAPLRALPNLYFDVSMLNHWEVLEHLFQTIPLERVIFGTDTPIALAGGKSVEINDQYTYVTSTPWPLSISDDHGKLVFTSFLYEELRALKKAAERLGIPNEAIAPIFFENGMRLLRSI